MGWPEDQNAQAVGVEATIRPTDSTLEACLSRLPTSWPAPESLSLIKGVVAKC